VGVRSLGFDPQLTQLPLVFDLPAVGALFEERWPQLDPGGGIASVAARRVLDTKYQPLVSCVTTYELDYTVEGGEPHRTIGTLELGASGPALRLFDQDPRLPWIATATDSEEMRRRLAGLPGLATGRARPLEITPIRYKPGARCVLRYKLAGGSDPQLLFGKILATDSDRLASSLAALAVASSDAPHMPHIAGPVGHWPDLRMLVQRAVVGDELHDVAFDVERDARARERWMGVAGSGLAGLHSETGVAGPRRTLTDDIDELDGYRAPMEQADPELAGSYARALELLRSRADGEPELVCSHGAFRTDQFMIQDGELVMIDLDSFCWANPARDVGNFLAYLQWKAMRQPHHAAFIEAGTRSFLDGYAAVRRAPDERWTRLYTAASLLKVAGRRFRSLTVKEWPRVPWLVEAAHAILAG
jgi:hypothetical protein